MKGGVFNVISEGVEKGYHFKCYMVVSLLIEFVNFSEHEMTLSIRVLHMTLLLCVEVLAIVKGELLLCDLAECAKRWEVFRVCILVVDSYVIRVLVVKASLCSDLLEV